MENINAKLSEEQRTKLIEMVTKNLEKSFEDFREQGAAIKLKSFALSMSLEILIETEEHSETFWMVVN